VLKSTAKSKLITIIQNIDVAQAVRNSEWPRPKKWIYFQNDMLLNSGYLKQKNNNNSRIPKKNIIASVFSKKKYLTKKEKIYYFQ